MGEAPIPKPDVDYATIFRMRAEGATHAQIAARMHVHRTTISRILANGQPFAVDGGPGPREREVEIIAQRFQGDDVEMATLGALRSVGRKLDQLDTAKAASSG